MARVCDPFSQASIHIVIDRDCVGRIRLALRRSDDTTCDPVVHDVHTDAVSRAHLIDGERPRWARRTENPMLEADPAYHAGSKGFAG